MVTEQYPLDQTKFIVEVGCGSGKFGIHFAATFGCNTTLLDVDPDQVDRAQRLLRTVEAAIDRRLPVRIDVGDVMNIGFPNDTFDLVFNEGVVEHWVGDPRVKCLQEMARVSRECVIVITNDVEGERSRKRALETVHHYEGMPEYEIPYSQAELQLALEHVGLERVSVQKCRTMETQEYLLGVGFKA